MKLGDVSEIIIGLTLNRELFSSGYNYPLFSFKNMETNENFEILSFRKKYQKEITQENDLLFRLVYPNKIVLVDNNLTNLLVSSQLCIIRPNPDLINPIFLKWYLESDLGKSKIEMQIIGTTIKKITVSSLRGIYIPKVPLETQNKISNLIIEWEKEKTNLKKLIDKKDKLYNELIMEKIGNDVNE